MRELALLPGEHYRLEDGSHLVVPGDETDAKSVAEHSQDGDVALRLAREPAALAGLMRPRPGKPVSEETIRRAAGLVALHLRRRSLDFDDDQQEAYLLLFTVLPGEWSVSVSAKAAGDAYEKKRALRPSAKTEAAHGLVAAIKADVQGGQVQSALEKAEEVHGLPPPSRKMAAKGVLDAFLKLGKSVDEDEPFYLPTLLAAHKAYRAVLSQFEAYLDEDEIPMPKGQAVLAPITGDQGEGRHLVNDILVATGRSVIEMEPGQAPEEIAESVKEHAPDTLVLTGLVPISLRLATDEHERLAACREAAKELVALLKREGLRDRLEVILVGFAFNRQFGRSLGADAVCRTLASLYAEFHHRKRKRKGT